MELNVIVLGAIQGLTEFLPVSSSGHLIVFREWLGVDLNENLAFDAALHLGTFVALLFYFKIELWNYLKGWIASLRFRSLQTPEQRMPWLILLGSVPAVVVGLLAETWIEGVLRSSVIVSVMLILVGCLMLVIERRATPQTKLDDLSWKTALWMGIAQTIALIPGTSRSGITIIAGMQQKLKRADAARFSFLLSVPITFGAGMKKLIDVIGEPGIPWGLFGLGILTSALVGWLALKFLLHFLSTHSLNGFAYYRFALAFIILLTLL